jgi:hypothetical protein
MRAVARTGAATQRFRLCLARRRSFRFLCLRIFLRRFLMTLPTDPSFAALRAPG